MKTRRWNRALAGSIAICSLVAAPLVAQATTNTTHASASSVSTAKGDVTSKAEAKLVDRVRTPKPDTFDCTEVFGVKSECGTVELPLDYDKPKGATTDVAYLRVPAKDQKNKIGTLFLNPGGPGGSGIDIASQAPFFLSPGVLKKFDVVGVDPRGTNFSDNVRCYKNLGEQLAGTKGLNVAFPYNKKEVRDYQRSSKNLGQACSSTGKPLSAHMATANVARDMDVMRRMFGDTKLSYLGFSYGSYLGNVYANTYPDRVRAVAIDGVLDPVAWAGTPATAGTPVTARIRSGEGATKAIDEILRLCKKAGPEFCELSSKGDPKKIYDELERSLKNAPLVIVDPDDPEFSVTVDYPNFVDVLLGELYAPFAPELIDLDVSSLYDLTAGPEAKVTRAEKKAASRHLVAQRRAQLQNQETTKAETETISKQTGFAFPYFNDGEAFQTVLCTDSVNPKNVRDWPKFADRAASTGTGFGRLWTWGSAPCASKTWTVKDTDSYRGSFSARTANPVLVVGNFWDPATNYDGAVRAASLLPNSRLLSSDNFGHTAYGTSRCVTSKVDTYLLTAKVPAAGTKCKSDFGAFEEPLFDEEDFPSSKRSAASAIEKEEKKQEAILRELPPVVPPIQGATPRF